jgi:hypothetical protein
MRRAREILTSGTTPERLPLIIEIGLAARAGGSGTGPGGPAPQSA